MGHRPPTLSYNTYVDVSPCRRFEEVPSDREAKPSKSAKRVRVSDVVEHEPVSGDKPSKKAKKLKAENGAAVPVSADTEAPKKGEKKDKKAKKGVESKEGDSKKEEGKGEKQGDKGAMRELPSGLKIQDAKVGDGPQAKSGMKVNMRYVGKLSDGKVFDSNTKGKPVRHPRYFYSRKTHVVVSIHSSRSGWGVVR